MKYEKYLKDVLEVTPETVSIKVDYFELESELLARYDHATVLDILRLIFSIEEK